MAELVDRYGEQAMRNNLGDGLVGEDTELGATTGESDGIYGFGGTGGNLNNEMENPGANWNIADLTNENGGNLGNFGNNGRLVGTNGNDGNYDGNYGKNRRLVGTSGYGNSENRRLVGASGNDGNYDGNYGNNGRLSGANDGNYDAAGAAGGNGNGHGTNEEILELRNMVQELKMELRTVKTSRKTLKGPKTLTKRMSPKEFNAWEMEFRSWFVNMEYSTMPAMEQQLILSQHVEPEILLWISHLYTRQSMVYGSNGTEMGIMEIIKNDINHRHPIYCRRLELFKAKWGADSKLDFRTWWNGFREDAKMAEVNEMSFDQLCILQAMAGCKKDDDLNKMIQMLDNPTLEEFEQTIFRYETKLFKKQMGGSSANGGVKTIEKSRGNGRGRGRNRSRNRSRSQSRDKSSTSGTSEERKKKACYFCKKEGHLKREGRGQVYRI